MARVLLGDALFADGMNPNQAIPELFIAAMPSWIAALFGAGVLAAVMSTADRLVVSTAQIFANDIYRRTLALRWGEGKDDKHVDHVALLISRVATVLVLVCAVAIAWNTRETNVALLVWIGVGGMMAASAAAMFLGVLWRRATRAGSITGFIACGVAFGLLHSGSIKAAWFTGGALEIPAIWLAGQATNPYACATLGAFIYVASMLLVSLMTDPPSDEHLERVFGPGSEFDVEN